MRKITGLLVALIVGGTIGIAITTLYKPGLHQILSSKAQGQRVSEVQEDDFKKAQTYLRHSNPHEAMKIISKHKQEIENQTPEGKLWLDLLVQASVEAHDTPQLMHIFSFDPNALESNEDAALLIGEQLVSSGNIKDYEALHAFWKKNARQQDRWFILDADALIFEKKTSEAIEMLQSKSLEGDNDTDRLVRLALLHMNDQPKAAWNYLVEAQKKNPDSTNVRTYRARFLESIGKPQLALTEYLAAISTDPKNPYLKDQLADFYLRSKKYDQALKLWSETLNPPTLDTVWLKTIFWNKTIAPINFNWSAAQVPEGYEAPLVNYLLSVPPGEFWDRKMFEQNPDLGLYLNSEQATYWLRMLQYLKNGEEDQAYVLSQYNPFLDQLWDPTLFQALQRVLNYRRNGTLRLPKEHESAAKIAPEQSQNPFNGNFFTELEQLSQHSKEELASGKISDGLQSLLKSPEVFSAIFLTGGWREAGLQLHKMRALPGDFPPWVSYNVTEALKNNRTTLDALKFATLQKKNPSLSLLIAELTIAGGSPDAGIVELERLAPENDDVGFRASWLLSLIYIEKKQYDDAKTTITANAKLEKSLIGQEALARIALLQGDTAAADKIYASIEQQSIEAKSYLARKAFADKDWTKAQQLTEELLKLYPTNQVLKDNLQKIQNEKSQTKP